MSSGFPGGGGNGVGGSDYFSAVGNLTGGGGSASSLSNMINTNTNTNNNIIANNSFQQNPYRSLVAGGGSVFPDPLSHLHNNSNQQLRRGLIGKRTLAEFQTHQLQNKHQQQNSFNVPQNLYQQQQHQKQELLSIYLRSVKQRHQNTSPISPLSPIDLLNEIPSLSSRRYGLPQLNHQQQQLLRSQQQIVSFGNNNSYQNFSIPNLVAQQQQQPQQPIPYQQQQLTVEQQVTVQKAVTETEAYQFVEKELFEADADDYKQHFDEESIITATTGWDELLAPCNQKVNNPISPSSSSSCSSTAPIASTSAAPMSSIQSLMEIAAAISEGRSDIATEILTRAMNQPGFLNQQGSAEQKIMFYVTAALRSRLNVSPMAAERSEFTSNQLLNQHSSCFKLGLMAANLSIIESTADALSIHVVDFSIGHGFQYHSLIQHLASRKSGKPKLLKITFVDLSANHDKASSSPVGEKLTHIGNLAGIPVQFASLNINLCDLTRESLHSDSDEVLVVNLAHTLYRIADESVSTVNPRDHLLRRVKGLKPRVTTIVEQELNCNSSQLGSRLNECSSYYGALFDSLDSTLAKDNPQRVNIEKEVSQKIMNSIACEGINRVERCEVYGKWRARMSMAGFQMKPLSQPITESIKSMVSGRGVNPNLNIKEENGGICFGWKGRTLIVVSSWC